MSRTFEDLESVKEVAQRLGKHPRTVMRWTRLPDGLPFIRLGNVPYLHAPTTQEWIERRITRPNPSRRRR